MSLEKRTKYEKITEYLKYQMLEEPRIFRKLEEPKLRTKIDVSITGQNFSEKNCLHSTTFL
jgi:hypothetical protein